MIKFILLTNKKNTDIAIRVDTIDSMRADDDENNGTHIRFTDGTNLHVIEIIDFVVKKINEGETNESH